MNINALLQRAWVLTSLRQAGRFHRALADPDRAQLQKLRMLLSTNTNTRFGSAHNFKHIQSLEQFQHSVPIRDGADFAQWFDAIEGGAQNVLSTSKIRFLEPTSGTRSKPKLVPWTDALINEVSDAVGPWYVDLARQYPALLNRAVYFFLSPAPTRAAFNAQGMKIGARGDGDYLDPISRAAMRQLAAVDPSVGQETNHPRWRKRTLEALFEHQGIGVLSMWSPTLFLRMLTDLPSYLSDLDLSAKTRSRIQRALHYRDAPFIRGLEVISCWTDGASAKASRELSAFFPNTPIQPKGLLATEGVVSMPYQGQHPLSVTSHFLEFQGISDEKVLLASQLKRGKNYRPILTTGGGLWRYRLGDIVVCDGFVGRTPSVRFEFREGGVSDLVGEKLYPQAVRQAIEKHSDAFTLLCPQDTHYLLFSEDDDASLATRVDEELRKNYHYDIARSRDQLGPIQFHHLRPGSEEKLRKHLAGSGRVGDVKIALLGTPPSADFLRSL